MFIKVGETLEISVVVMHQGSFSARARYVPQGFYRLELYFGVLQKNPEEEGM